MIDDSYASPVEDSIINQTTENYNSNISSFNLTLESLRIDDDSGLNESNPSPGESKTIYYRRRQTAMTKKAKVTKPLTKNFKISEFLVNKSAMERRSFLNKSLEDSNIFELKNESS